MFIPGTMTFGGNEMNKNGSTETMYLDGEYYGLLFVNPDDK
jgi:hypothetical protein